MYERYIDWLPLTGPQLGSWPTTQARALTGNSTSDALVLRLAQKPLSHTSQGNNQKLLKQFNLGAILWPSLLFLTLGDCKILITFQGLLEKKYNMRPISGLLSEISKVK